MKSVFRFIPVFLLLFSFAFGVQAKNFRVTACSEVDPQDADIFQSRMKANGYTLDKRYDDGQISLSSFNPESDVDFVYNASHGSDYYICFAGGSGGMDGGQFTGAKVKHLVTASCDTVSSRWKGHSGFSSSLITVLGYHLVCYNDCAHHAAKSFADSISGLDPSGDASAFVEAWKKANTSFDTHASRAWAAVTKSGYSSGAGADTSTDSNSDWDWNWDQWAMVCGQDVSRAKGADLPMIVAAPENSGSAKSFRGALKNVSMSSGARHVEFRDSAVPCAFDKDFALGQAIEFIEANGGLPADAQLYAIVPIVHQEFGGSESVINYVVSFKRIFNGLEISGRTGDCINVLIGSEGVVSYSRLWRNISETGMSKQRG
ncbi:MAG: hypothetical protein PHQ23_04435, partial [Candidatus Wallbacteria bacterium]|nr:hypothetical protein [Candidatus Wallbacteria bacterium]